MKHKNIKYTVITTSITIGSLIGSAINGIIGYIAVWFFAPLWIKLINRNKNDQTR